MNNFFRSEIVSVLRFLKIISIISLLIFFTVNCGGGNGGDNDNGNGGDPKAGPSSLGEFKIHDGNYSNNISPWANSTGAPPSIIATEFHIADSLKNYVLKKVSFYTIRGKNATYLSDQFHVRVYNTGCRLVTSSTPTVFNYKDSRGYAVNNGWVDIVNNDASNSALRPPTLCVEIHWSVVPLAIESGHNSFFIGTDATASIYKDQHYFGNIIDFATWSDADVQLGDPMITLNRGL